MTVAAIVVTHNRLSDLKVCLDSLRAQTRPLDAIFVVNNGSTDGTAEWLQSQENLVLTTQGNLGGAGGFAAGLSRAHEAGYDQLWCMDDDCVAEPDSLQRLLQSPDIGPSIKNCVSVSTLNSELLAFGMHQPYRSFHRVSDLTGSDLIMGVASLFNGTLISAEIVKDIGVPDPKLFIWGDEVEYMTRAMARGYPVCTVPGAIFHHPPAFDRDGIPWPGAWKRYYAVRNQRRVFQNQQGRSIGRAVYVRWAARLVGQQFGGKRGNRLYNVLLTAEAAFDAACGNFRKRPEHILTLRLYKWRQRRSPGGSAPSGRLTTKTT
jgi:rhamnopyranosyl-N-acetylglucosaminyl-diphospho-decaprenol beta-1,3/1,4-galactofuranosyltransferase